MVPPYMDLARRRSENVAVQGLNILRSVTIAVQCNERRHKENGPAHTEPNYQGDVNDC